MATLTLSASYLLDEGSILVADPVLQLYREGLPDERHHYEGATLAPAFLDVHTHGCCGRDVMEASADALDAMGAFLARHGVGAYLPTTITAPRDATLRSLAGLARLLARPAVPGQAQPLGLHLEGPFLAHAKRGAHPAQDLLAPSIAFFDAMWDAAEGRVLLLTLAPELPGALDLIAHAVSRGVRVSIGHSDGAREDAEAAVAAGAVSATHTFNAMRGLGHREPGLLGAVLTEDRLYAELICDGLHVDPAMVKLFARAKPRRKVLLITDAMSATGMPDGTYKLGELSVQVAGGRCITGTNTLAGSTLTLDRGVRNYVRFAEVSLATALCTVTHNPARMLGLPVPAGYAVLSPAGDLLATYLDGRLLPHE